MVVFAVTPQWQGSASSRALRLLDGVEAIAGDLPSASIQIVNVPPGAGTDLGTHLRQASAVIQVRTSLQHMVETRSDFIFTVGGSACSAWGGIEHVLAHSREPTTIVRFSGSSGWEPPKRHPAAFDSSFSRVLVGDVPAIVRPTTVTDRRNLILVGSRDEWSESAGGTSLPVNLVSDGSLASAVEASGASRVYIHINLDVLDPAYFGSVPLLYPFGLEPQQLIDSIRAISHRFTVVGAALTGFAPASDTAITDSMPTILRIVGAVLQAKPVSEG